MKFVGSDEYVATADLMVAVNAAITLERPLLVKGEPGTGKTELARQIASGLGLPLLEVQYAGLVVVAPDQAVFREVLGSSGIFIPPDDAGAAAAIIAAALRSPGWRHSSVDRALANLERWNGAAALDAARARAMFSQGAANDSADARLSARRL